MSRIWRSRSTSFPSSLRSLIARTTPADIRCQHLSWWPWCGNCCRARKLASAPTSRIHPSSTGWMINEFARNWDACCVPCGKRSRTTSKRSGAGSRPGDPDRRRTQQVRGPISLLDEELGVSPWGVEGYLRIWPDDASRQSAPAAGHDVEPQPRIYPHGGHGTTLLGVERRRGSHMGEAVPARIRPPANRSVGRTLRLARDRPPLGWLSLRRRLAGAAGCACAGVVPGGPSREFRRPFAPKLLLRRAPMGACH